jgi:hypothetical protein
MREIGRFGFAGSREADAGGSAEVALQTAIGSFYAEGSLSGLLWAAVKHSVNQLPARAGLNTVISTFLEDT